MKLAQGQIWKTHPDTHSHNGEPLHLRIVELERLSVGYKEITDLKKGHGRHKKATKKEFCRLIKGAEEVTAGRNFAKRGDNMRIGVSFYPAPNGPGHQL